MLALVGFLLCAGLPMIALLLPAVQSAREAARRAQCSNNLKQIGLAFHNYHDSYGCLPPAYIPDGNGQPMHSWRVLILPFVEQSPLYDQYDFDEPWNGPNNSKLPRNARTSSFARPTRGKDRRPPATSRLWGRKPPGRARGESAWMRSRIRKARSWMPSTTSTAIWTGLSLFEDPAPMGGATSVC